MATVLENSIRIDAPPDRIWAALASLDALHRYDPGIRKAEVISPSREGVGASRRCELAQGGWYKEAVAEWRPREALAFQLFECTLPVRRLQHRYTLTREGGETRVTQRMEYELKFGLVGRLMDILMVRKKWDAGVKAFFHGLKQYVESGQRPAGQR